MANRVPPRHDYGTTPYAGTSSAVSLVNKITASNDNTRGFLDALMTEYGDNPLVCFSIKAEAAKYTPLGRDLHRLEISERRLKSYFEELLEWDLSRGVRFLNLDEGRGMAIYYPPNSVGTTRLGASIYMTALSNGSPTMESIRTEVMHGQRYHYLTMIARPGNSRYDMSTVVKAMVEYITKGVGRGSPYPIWVEASTERIARKFEDLGFRYVVEDDYVNLHEGWATPKGNPDPARKGEGVKVWPMILKAGSPSMSYR